LAGARLRCGLALVLITMVVIRKRRKAKRALATA
jgi:hypothetical protein